MKSRRMVALLVAMVMVIVLAILPGCSGTKTDLSMTEDVNKYAEKIDMDYAFDTAKELSVNKDLHSSEVGFRTAGSDAEHKGADYLVEAMNELGWS